MLIGALKDVGPRKREWPWLPPFPACAIRFQPRLELLTNTLLEVAERGVQPLNGPALGEPDRARSASDERALGERPGECTGERKRLRIRGELPLTR
jgi:hypothetical protein